MFREFRAGAVIEDKTHTIKGLIKELKPLFLLLGFMFLASSTAFGGVLLLADIINAILRKILFEKIWGIPLNILRKTYGCLLL